MTLIQGDYGIACTSVVTEYHQKHMGQSPPIAIEVESMSGSEIEGLIRELLVSYRQLYFPDVENDASPKEYKHYVVESEHAWSALEAAFGDHPEFNKDLLRDQSSGADHRLVTQLLRWAESLVWPEGSSNGVWKSVAETAEDCCAQTSVFMEDTTWPFTKIIRYLISRSECDTMNC